MWVAERLMRSLSIRTGIALSAVAVGVLSLVRMFSVVHSAEEIYNRGATPARVQSGRSGR